MSPTIEYTVSHSDGDLRQILELQRRNLPQNITEAELIKEGFVTVHHSFDILKKMNSPYPHIIAKADNQVIGYTLVMLPECRNLIPVLIPMFSLFDSLSHQGIGLKDLNYVVMGQVCIDKNYRGKGVFAGLYGEMKKRLAPQFDCILTEIARRNPRSIRAHEKVGFEVLKEYSSGGEDWVVVVLDIKRV